MRADDQSESEEDHQLTVYTVTTEVPPPLIRILCKNITSVVLCFEELMGRGLRTYPLRERRELSSECLECLLSHNSTHKRTERCQRASCSIGELAPVDTVH